MTSRLPESSPVKPAGRFVLLIEDSPADVVLLKEALERLGAPFHLSVSLAGREALREQGRSLGALPDRLLIDLNLPGMTGS